MAVGPAGGRGTVRACGVAEVNAGYLLLLVSGSTLLVLSPVRPRCRLLGAVAGDPGARPARVEVAPHPGPGEPEDQLVDRVDWMADCPLEIAPETFPS